MKNTVDFKGIVKSLKGGLKPRGIMEAKLFKDTIANPDIPLDDIFEAEDIIREQKLNQWIKGHTTGTIGAVGGIIIGIGLATLKNK